MAPINPPPNPFKRDSSWYQPGMTADRGGVYVVHHYGHRRSHQVMVPAGTVFPKCKVCGHKVQFAPIVAAQTWHEDVDFAAEPKRRRRSSGAA